MTIETNRVYFCEDADRDEETVVLCAHCAELGELGNWLEDEGLHWTGDSETTPDACDACGC